MDKTPIVSIVLPVFNGELFLVAAIDSVRTQSYSNWELLIVDDGSADGTPGICDAYATKDSRIKVFHQSNGGVNTARAKGIDMASGEYLTFLDADDSFTPDALEVMMEAFTKDTDVVYCGSADETHPREAYLIALWKGEIKPGICTKMFRTGLFKQMDYRLERKLVMGEDLLLNSIYALDINKARSISRDCYLINSDNEASVTKTFKHNWEYEKYFFSTVEDRFLSKCTSFHSYDSIRLAVNKCWLNAMKYVMLDGGRINYRDDEFIRVKDYFLNKKAELGPSEKLVFTVRNAPLYSFVIKSYTRLIKLPRLFRTFLSAEFLRFVLVGLLATALHYGIYRLLNLVIPANPAYAAGYILSFLINFFLTSAFTFKKKATVRKGFGFGLSHLVNFTLHMVLLNVFLFLGMNEAWAPIPVYCICIPVNFLLVRLVFNKL